MPADMAREAEVVRRTRTDATWHARPHGRVSEGHAAHRGASGADTWQEATRVHAGPRARPCGAPRGMGVGSWRAHRLVGPGNMIGVVTQWR